MSAIINRGTSTLKPAATADEQPAPSPAPPPHGTAGFDLPEAPLAVIQPGRSWSAFDVRELWAYRELLYFLTWRDLKVRYKQAALGVAWVVMQPLASAVIFTVFLGRLARVPSGDLPYPLFVYSGLLLWTFFAGAVSQSGNSLVGSAHLITKVYFPRLLIPAAAVGARLVDFAIAFVLLFAMLAYYRVPLGWSALALPVPVALSALLALAVGAWASALNVKYRDVGVALPVLVQLWMFASPVVYPSALVPAEWRRLYALNPLVGIVEGFRSALFGLPFDYASLGISAAVTLASLVGAAVVFRRMEKGFADVV